MMLGLAAGQGFSEMANLICQMAPTLFRTLPAFSGAQPRPRNPSPFFTTIRIVNDSTLATLIFWVNSSEMWGVPVWRWVLTLRRAPNPSQAPMLSQRPVLHLRALMAFLCSNGRGKSLCRAGAGSESMWRDELPFPLVNLKLFYLCFLLQVGKWGKKNNVDRSLCVLCLSFYGCGKEQIRPIPVIVIQF